MLGEKRLKGATGDSPGTPVSHVHWNWVLPMAAKTLHIRGFHMALFGRNNDGQDSPVF